MCDLLVDTRLQRVKHEKSNVLMISLSSKATHKAQLNLCIKFLRQKYEINKESNTDKFSKA